MRGVRAREQHGRADGGALALAGAARADATGARFAGNSAGANGGAVALAALARLDLVDGANRFVANQCGAYGGGLFMANSSLRVASTAAESDDGARAGGAAASGGPTSSSRTARRRGRRALLELGDDGRRAERARGVRCATTWRAYGARARDAGALHRRRDDNATEEVSGTGAFRAPVVVTAYDAYGQRTTTSADADGARVTLSCATASLGGSYSSVAMADGECVVDEVSAMLGPSVAIELAAELAFTTPAGSALRLSDTVGVYLRACQSGEYVSGADGARQCLTCEAPAFFAFEPAVTECRACPARARRCAGNVIDIPTGFWRAPCPGGPAADFATSGRCASGDWPSAIVLACKSDSGARAATRRRTRSARTATRAALRRVPAGLVDGRGRGLLQGLHGAGSSSTTCSSASSRSS